MHLYRVSSAELAPGARRLWALAREQTDGWPAVKQDQARLARRLRERQEASQAFFAGAAAQWDRLRDELYGRAFSQSALLALLPENAVIADLLPHDRDDFRRQLGQQTLGFELEQINAMLKEAGFAITRSMPLPPEGQAMGPGLFLVTAQRKAANAESN